MQRLALYTKSVSLLGLLLLLSHFCQAQFATPTIDGVVSAGEYGTHTNGQNQQTSGGTTWYMTWDNTNLYVAVVGVAATQAAAIYLDKDPVTPVNGGTDAAGNLAGLTAASPQLTQLPFRADYALYSQSGALPQYSTANGNGGWTALASGGATSSTVGTTQEIQIPWSQLGGRPARFNWLGFLNTSSFDAYVPLPAAAAGSTGTVAIPAASYYYTVSSTEGGAATPPFSQTSFTLLNPSTDRFGSISVFDFTVNASAANTTTGTINLSRGCFGGDWNIAGTLVVGTGAVRFGQNAGSICDAYGATTINNVLVTTGGTLDLEFTTTPLVVAGNVQVQGGTLRLSSNTNGNGDLRLSGNLTVASGTFMPSPNSANRSVVLTGSAQTLTGYSRLPLNNLRLQQSSGGTVTLGSNAAVAGTVTFGSGQLVTGQYVLDLGTTGSLANESSTSNILGFASSTKTVGASTTSTPGNPVNFGNLGLVLQTTGSSSQLGNAVVVTRSRGLAPLQDKSSPRQSIQRSYRVVPNNSGGTYDVTLQLSYFDAELSSLDESTLGLFSSPDAETQPTSGNGTLTAVGGGTLNTSTNVLTRNNLADVGNGSRTGIVFTLSSQAAPLPVTLVSFEGARTASGAVALAWQTAQEANNAGFTVERQTAAGAPWQALTTVPGAGNSQGQRYDYADNTAPAGTTLYYRLRQTDLDSTVTYSPVVAVGPAAADLAAPALRLSPVPVPADQATLAVDLSTLPAAARSLTVYDLQGRQLLRSTAPAAASSTTLSLRNLAAGVYMLLVRSGGTSYRARFNKL